MPNRSLRPAVSRAASSALPPSVLAIALPPVGSKWREADLRVARTVEIIRYDMPNSRVRINCIETQRLTWAKPERFNGKSGGYIRIT